MTKSVKHYLLDQAEALFIRNNYDSDKEPKSHLLVPVLMDEEMWDAQDIRLSVFYLEERAKQD